MDILDTVWPKSERGVNIGSHMFQIAELSSFDGYEFKQPYSEYIPGPYGGYLLKFSCGTNAFVSIYQNDGMQVFHTYCQPALSHRKFGHSTQIDPRNAFWCSDGHIGILDYLGCITIMTVQGDHVATYYLPETVERVCCDYPFTNGIAFYTANPYNFYVFDYSAKSSYLLCPSGTCTQEATAIAYSDGTGFVSFIDNTLGMIKDDGLMIINNFTFQPTKLMLSPHGSMLIAKDAYHLYVRSTNSTQYYQPVSIDPHLQDTQFIGDIAFFDETTIAYILCAGNHPVLFLVQQGQSYQLDLLTNCHIYHLIQSNESVRIYKGNGIENSEELLLYLITPQSEKILIMLDQPYVDEIETLFEAKKYYDDGKIDCFKMLEDLHGYNQDPKKKRSNEPEHDNLNELLNVIIEACPHIMQTIIAEDFLSHAAFAKYFVKDFPNDTFANCIKQMRLLYKLRKNEGFVTVQSDLENIDQNEFLSYITHLQKYELAEEYAQQFHLNRSVIAENWSIEMFRKYKSGKQHEMDAFSKSILKILGRYSSINYLHVATVINDQNAGNESIIRQIVSMIPDPQIRMIFIFKNSSIYRNSDNEALADVLKSKDGNAIISYICLIRNKTQVRLGDFFKNSNVLQEQYSNFKSPENLPDKKGYKTVIEKIKEYPPIKKFQLELLYGYKCYGAYGFGFSSENLNEAKKNSCLPYSKCIDDQLFLINPKNNLGAEPAPVRNDPLFKPPPTRSPRYYMEKAIAENREDRFRMMAKKFDVKDSVQCHIKLKVYSKTKQWNRLQEMMKKKQPIEWVRFAEACAENGNMELAKEFIDKISNKEDRIDTFMSFRMYPEAFEVAKASKNQEKMEEIRQYLS